MMEQEIYLNENGDKISIDISIHAEESIDNKLITEKLLEAFNHIIKIYKVT
jgi:hypothetical protein